MPRYEYTAESKGKVGAKRKEECKPKKRWELGGTTGDHDVFIIQACIEFLFSETNEWDAEHERKD